GYDLMHTDERQSKNLEESRAELRELAVALGRRILLAGKLGESLAFAVRHVHAAHGTNMGGFELAYFAEDLIGPRNLDLERVFIGKVGTRMQRQNANFPAGGTSSGDRLGHEVSRACNQR